MTPTNLPVQPAVLSTPAAAPATAAEQSPAADFFLMLGQLVAASVQSSGTPVAPTPKVPLTVLDGSVKKEDVDPEELLAMFAMAMHPQPQPVNVDAPVEQVPQAAPAVVMAAADAPVQNVLQEVARQVTEGKVFAEIVTDDLAQGADAAQAPDTVQAPTAFQPQQPQTANAHVQHAISRPVHAPVGSAAWADDIGARVVMMTESGNHSASLKLSPEHLGPLEINITVRDDKASVWFGAAHADTRAAIETALPRLREMFEAQGLSLADAGVFREPPREQALVKNDAMSAEQGEGVEEVASVERARLGLVDAYA
jgi:flagellar hook-length control protein FliK